MPDFYETPSQEIFDDIANKSKDLWRKRYDDEYGYVTEKTDRIDQISNFKDNWGSIFGMFDHQNQSLLLRTLTNDARTFILERVGSNYGGSFADLEDL